MCFCFNKRNQRQLACGSHKALFLCVSFNGGNRICVVVLFGVASVKNLLDELLCLFLGIGCFEHKHRVYIRNAVLLAFAAGNADQIFVLIHINRNSIKFSFRCNHIRFRIRQCRKAYDIIFY